MEKNLEIKGEKGSRKVIKTIGIHEESYEAIQNMISSGQNLTDDICGPLVEDTYNIFGGNCYDMMVSMAVEHLIGGVVHNLEEKHFLSIEGSEAFSKISDCLFPSMCYTQDEDGTIDEELRFFEVCVEEIIENVTHCLASEVQQIFTNNLTEAVKDDNRPAGEIALGILMYISTGVCAEEDKEEVAN